ncbi:hypothetical protein NL523_28615, partial [Klebsiella pneumoniae]|nr:hypothetical protein [Klebsiella pneumoniae]MCP6663713.1 hypothetical protein [Klebsiella pneumoniae]
PDYPQDNSPGWSLFKNPEETAGRKGRLTALSSCSFAWSSIAHDTKLKESLNSLPNELELSFC